MNKLAAIEPTGKHLQAVCSNVLPLAAVQFLKVIKNRLALAKVPHAKKQELLEKWRKWFLGMKDG